MKYTDNHIIEAIKSSESIRQVLIKLNLKPAGGNYQTIHNLIKKLNIDISHIKGCSWAKNKTFHSKRPITDYLSNKVYKTSYLLKIRLIKENILEAKCSNCNLTEWLGQTIPLELDHIDGNHNNNELSNLRVLCPNCHAMTPNYRGKKLKQLKNYQCLDCKKPITTKGALRCKSCAKKL